MITKPRAASIALLASLLTVISAGLASAAPVEVSTASAAGLRLRADLLGTTLLNTSLAVTRVPDPDAENPDRTSAAVVGPIRIPENGQLISDISALNTVSQRTTGTLPTAKAEAHTGHVMLLESGGEPMIGVDAIDAVSTSVCTAPGKASVSADGSRLIGLVIGGTPIDVTPEPNTVVPLVYTGDPDDPADDMGIKVILNEQRGADAGTGLIVTMIHVIAFSQANPNIIYADVRIAEAQSSVYCGNTTPPTDDEDKVVIDKIVVKTTSDPAGATDGTKATAHRGEDVTWTITITNNGDLGCGILTVTDTLPPHFTFVSSSGDLSSGSTAGSATVDGDRDVSWTNNGRYPLPPGASLTETIVAKVSPTAPFGTYTNLVNITQSTCSSFTQGLRGPVDVIPAEQVLGRKKVNPRPAPARAPDPGTLPATGVATVLLGMLSLATSIAGAEMLRRSK